MMNQLNPTSNNGIELFNHAYLQTLAGECQLDALLGGFELDHNTILVLHRNCCATANQSSACLSGKVGADQVLGLHKMEYLS